MKSISPNISPLEMPIPEAKKGVEVVPMDPIVKTATARIDLLENSVKSIFLNNSRMEKLSDELCNQYLNIYYQVKFIEFDYLICSFFRDDCTVKDLNNFIDNLVSMEIDPCNFTKEDAIAKTNEINIILETLREKSFRYTSKIWSIKHPRDKIFSLKNIFISLYEKQTKMQETLEKDIEKGYKDLEELIMNVFDFEIVEPITKNPIEKFKNWLFNEINCDPNDEDFLELQSLVARAAYRIGTLKQLQERVTNIKSMLINHKTTDPSFCDKKALNNSPFFISLSKQSNFLRKMLITQDNELEMTNEITDIIDSCNKSFQMYQERCANVLSDIDKHFSGLQEFHRKKEEELANLKKELSPKLNSFVNEMQYYVKDKSVEEMNDLLCKTIEIKQYKGTDKEQTWDAFLDILVGSFNDDFAKTESLYKKAANQLNSIAISDTIMLNLIEKPLNATIVQNEAKKEADALNAYEKGLKSISDSLKDIDAKSTISEFESIRESIIAATEVYNTKTDTSRILNGKEGKKNLSDKIEEVKQQISSLREEANNISSEIGICNAELDLIVEDKFANDAKISTKNSKKNLKQEQIVEYGAINKYLKMIMCPSCRENQRDVIITSCGHALCSKCLQRKKVCPICGKKFTEKNVKKLNF